jgi:hypothetical protein
VASIHELNLLSIKKTKVIYLANKVTEEQKTLIEFENKMKLEEIELKKKKRLEEIKIS